MPRRGLTKRQLEELIKCKNDVVYFITNYLYYKHVVKGKIKWDKPYPYQVKFWKTLQAGRNPIINKTRQIGCSWAAAAFAIWLICFHPDVEILFLSETERKAIRLLKNSRFMYDSIPSWMKPRLKDNSQTRFSVRFSAKQDGEIYIAESSIDSLTLTPRTAAGYSAALIVFDEAAHMQSAEEVFMAAKPAISHGGQMAVISTPGGLNNFFFRLWSLSNKEVRDGLEPGFVPIEAYWKDCGLTEKWYKAATAGMTKMQILQEYEMKFLSTGSPFFDLEALDRCFYPTSSYEEIKNDDGFNIKRITAMSFTGVDSAQGNRTKSGTPDYTSIVTLNEYGVEIDSWHSNDTPLQEVAGYTLALGEGEIGDLPGIVEKWHIRYPGGMIIEKFGPGDVVFARQAQRYPNDDKSYVVGRQPTRQLKQRMLNRLKLAIAGKQVIITDDFTYDCLRAFEDKGNGKYEATEGFFDDPVIALALAYSDLHKWGGYQVELGHNEVLGRRVVALDQKDDVPLEQVSRFLPVGQIVLGPIWEEAGERRLVDQVEEMRV